MLSSEMGAEMHGQIALALADLAEGAITVAATRLRRLQELVDAAVPDVDEEEEEDG